MAKRKPKTTPGSERIANPKHELFCYLYAGSHNSDLFGNGSQCYKHVYQRAETERLEDLIEEMREKKPPGYTVKLDQYQARLKSLDRTARSESSDLLTKPNILARVNYLMDKLVDSDFMDRELAYTAGQRHDLSSKVAAIKEYNRLKDRGSNKLEGTFNFRWEDPEPAPKSKK